MRNFPIPDPVVKPSFVCRVGCDIVVFLVFNEFNSCTGGGSDGHQFSGIAEGGVCEGTSGSGYVIAVDQGMYNVRRPLKDLSSEGFVLGVEPVIEISLSD